MAVNRFDGVTVRYIYMDEAGTDTHAPVSVVVGIVVQPDRQWRSLERRIDQVRRAHVPDDAWTAWKRHFHMKDLFNGGKLNRDEWPPAKRHAIVRDLLSILREEKVPIAIGYARRAEQLPDPLTPVQKAKWDHVLAFSQCVNCADKYLRRSAPDEIACLVAEDVPELKRHLKETLKWASSEDALEQCEAFGSVTQIVDSIYWQGKDDAVLLQLADACAYMVARYFANKRDVGDFMKALTNSRAPFDRNAGSGQFLLAHGSLFSAAVDLLGRQPGAA
jgi:hypothetical protein